MIRLFVGLPLPEDLRLRLAELRGPVAGARWVPAGNMHVTLRFIGEVGTHTAEDIDAALSRLAAPAFELTVGGLGHFASRGRVRALWAAVGKNPALEHLQAKIENACQRAGLPPEGRRFHPHVTLARCKDTRERSAEAFVATHGGFRAPPVAIRRFVLFSSSLGGTGSVYTEEAAYPLA